MYLERLNQIMKVPFQTYNNGTNEEWLNVQIKLGCELPKDYKRFLNAYGTGGIRNFIWILTPFEKDENINLFSRIDIMKEAYQYMKNQFPQEFSYNIYPQIDGLIPWGYTENGDELY